MKDWKAAVRNWIRNDLKFTRNGKSKPKPTRRPPDGLTFEENVDRLWEASGRAGPPE
jgi:hypothetical protein